MQSREKAVSSGQSNGTSSEREHTLTLASPETCILTLLNSAGQSLTGRIVQTEIVTSPNYHTIDITLDDSCARNLAMELITAVSRRQCPLKLRLKYPRS